MVLSHVVYAFVADKQVLQYHLSEFTATAAYKLSPSCLDNASLLVLDDDLMLLLIDHYAVEYEQNNLLFRANYKLMIDLCAYCEKYQLHGEYTFSQVAFDGRQNQFTEWVSVDTVESVLWTMLSLKSEIVYEFPTHPVPLINGRSINLKYTLLDQQNPTDVSIINTSTVNDLLELLD